MNETRAAPRSVGLETRSIDYVPKNERHGKVWHIGPLWFMNNAQLATLAVGTTRFALGGNPRAGRLSWLPSANQAGQVRGGRRNRR